MRDLGRVDFTWVAFKIRLLAATQPKTIADMSYHRIFSFLLHHADRGVGSGLEDDGPPNHRAARPWLSLRNAAAVEPSRAAVVTA